MITIFGWLSAALMLAVLAKFVSKRLSLKRANAFLMKYHRTFSQALIATSLLHGVLALVTLGAWSPAVLVTGASALLCILAAARSTKREKNWRIHHRHCAAAALLIVLIHIVLHTHH